MQHCLPVQAHSMVSQLFFELSQEHILQNKKMLADFFWDDWGNNRLYIGVFTSAKVEGKCFSKKVLHLKHYNAVCASLNLRRIVYLYWSALHGCVAQFTALIKRLTWRLKSDHTFTCGLY